MGDGVQKLAFDTVDASEAPTLVANAVSWMIAQGYIGEAQKEFEWSDDLSHPPGPNWRDIVDDARRWRGLINTRDLNLTPPPGARPYDMAQFLETRPNGVKASAERMVCDAGENWTGFEFGICPACDQEVGLDAQVNDCCAPWFEGEACTLTCPSCGAVSRLEDWDLQPFWAFSNAALLFWNWPALSEAFVRNLADALGGLRVRHIVGKY
ncbi:MAG TPA: hypothetical protein VGO52_20715 [Hyphomonadaceae bacterium]|jgi:hypothetical protein|nr:hypothetical protein [Hyphomonadaceae bacterium]